MTSKELKNILDLHIKALVIMPGTGDSGFFIMLAPHHYKTAKYSCTTEEREFFMHNGRVLYKGFELSTTKGLSPYRRS